MEILAQGVLAVLLQLLVVGLCAQPDEATLPKLDCSKARTALAWRPRFSLEEAHEKVVEWHKGVAASEDARELSFRQLENSCLESVGAA